MTEYRTQHLGLSTDGGLVWVRSLDGQTEIDIECCGYVVRPYWPACFGTEPEWFQGEVDELLAWWEEDQRLEEGETNHLWESLSLSQKAVSDRRAIL